MAASANKSLRCAIYTRKSTEHGLELEFNSLDAQREACAAYIRSQASQGWQAILQHYDDPAYSGGNLERPALRRLLKDIEAGRIDIVVVYKIDRLTRSLADFAKLVEAFDKKSISFVAVTQQFNTTSSMGRLTLNVLLSFAQFERELSSERVRDKVAASRRKGKWTGGTVPLGYRAENKKLVIDKAEAETVRTIFRCYLDLKSFTKLTADLDKRGIVTKRRQTKVAKYNGGIPFTYGPLAHFLKNRLYVGEIGYKGKWFPGEHRPIVDLATFEAVQALLTANGVKRKAPFTASGAILMGKIYDDRGNRMRPTYSVKNGVRYRFYVSSALLRGRKGEVGTVGRVPAQEVETTVLAALPSTISSSKKADPLPLDALIAVTVGANHLEVSYRASDDESKDGAGKTVRIAWAGKKQSTGTTVETSQDPVAAADASLLQSIVRAHAWLRALSGGSYASVEALAEAIHLHPKVIRLGLRLAWLSPSITASILTGGGAVASATIGAMTRSLPLSWTRQEAELG